MRQIPHVTDARQSCTAFKSVQQAFQFLGPLGIVLLFLPLMQGILHGFAQLFSLFHEDFNNFIIDFVAIIFVGADSMGRALGVSSYIAHLIVAPSLLAADFDGDRSSDLAIGIRDQTVDGVEQAGAVQMIFTAGLFEDGFE